LSRFLFTFSSMVSTRSNSKPSEIYASIIVPAYKEKDNLAPLIDRVYKAMGSKAGEVEIIVVDDNSRDGTEQVMQQAQKLHPHARLIVRTTERGLSSAVLRGFEEARGKLLICMDADLQHPPESVPDMLNALESSPFVIGTRYGSGEFSVDKDWPMYRQLISKGARMLAMPLTSLSDPMTGFFGIQQQVFISGKDISGIGFKICMELYVKCRIKRHAEVPIHFGVRAAGESKLSSKVILHYVKHLSQLYFYKFPIFILLFANFAVVLLYGVVQMLG
jgi:dolichol-phosphate mannosyltransferase